jgi:flagellar FliJ protein
MKRFTFRLERILRYKIQIEEQKRLFLAARMEELKNNKEKLLKMTREREEYSRQYSSYFNGHIDINRLKIARRFLDKLHVELINQAKKVIETEKKVEKAKLDLIEAMRDRKKFENLKERKLQAYEKESNKEEQKYLDEFAGQAGTRNSVNNGSSL